ncbi:DUF4405 domain-containing protein [Rugamonas sp.]|uniref:DUF4405 domain-containing protein n=1 Tax=Rugamonas sp. TaxID=1926287 RepID=UPI0025CDF3CA|nr:DUF4405 domain-containing protein [Rugamonas sp.]
MPNLHQPLLRPPAQLHVNLRVERWHRRWIYASAAVLLLSGSAWLVARYFLRPAGQFGETVHPLEPWAMKLHGAAAMAMLFFLGSLLNVHVRRAIRAGRNLVSGWAMIAAMAVLTATGFGLYYLAGESDRPLWSALHWVVGLAAGALFVLHVQLGRRRARSADDA